MPAPGTGPRPGGWETLLYTTHWFGSPLIQQEIMWRRFPTSIFTWHSAYLFVKTPTEADAPSSFSLLFPLLLRRFDAFSCHGLPELLPPNMSLPFCRLPVPYVKQTYGIPPKSILSSSSWLFHWPSSLKLSPITLVWIRESSIRMWPAPYCLFRGNDCSKLRHARLRL